MREKSEFYFCVGKKQRNLEKWRVQVSIFVRHSKLKKLDCIGAYSLTHCNIQVICVLDTDLSPRW